MLQLAPVCPTGNCTGKKKKRKTQNQLHEQLEQAERNDEHLTIIELTMWLAG